MELLRMSKAAKRLGIHPMTLRQWAVDGKIPFMWVGRERRFSSVDVENMKRGSASSISRPRREILYVRVSGSSGQESSLAAQEEELRATSTGEVVKVVKDRGSGLRENRPGLNRVLAMVSDGSVSVVRVTHEDRLARFGVGWLKQLFAVHGVTLEVLHPKKSGGRDELLEDFVSLVTTFAGRLYGMRSAQARKRLLAESGQCAGGGDAG
ncbi:MULTISPECIES: IS607 family transposase [Streptomyces]|jgi:excisionase family DNA binding protein|uniref:IS607 family transposase n=2 Tax=Streptomyces TaxID=1883 RepID=UPI0022540D7A|nr:MULTISPECIES: IS607 family transposase [Streptomyces]MCX4429763.1 IS607 family transposase [Streptomyces mirabilis]